jgi:hypothetical protein
MYLMFPLIGIVGLVLGIYYEYITERMTKYKINSLLLEETKEATLLAGQRVVLRNGTACKLRHIVDKPSLNGVIATIVSDGTDSLGKVSVSVSNDTVLKFEEFQVTVTTEEEELKTSKELSQLRAAELVHNFEERADGLKLHQMLYVTLGQVT